MTQGLWVALLGMATVFLALGLLMVVIMLLDRAFRDRASREEPPAAAESAPVEAEHEEKAIAAAIGLAIALSQRRPAGEARGQLPSPSAWRLIGRRQQMSSSGQRWQTR